MSSIHNHAIPAWSKCLLLCVGDKTICQYQIPASVEKHMIFLLTEIGYVRRFHNGSALIAYAGIDAPPFQSGTFIFNRVLTKFLTNFCPERPDFYCRFGCQICT